MDPTTLPTSFLPDIVADHPVAVEQFLLAGECAVASALGDEPRRAAAAAAARTTEKLPEAFLLMCGFAHICVSSILARVALDPRKRHHVAAFAKRNDGAPNGPDDDFVSYAAEVIAGVSNWDFEGVYAAGATLTVDVRSAAVEYLIEAAVQAVRQWVADGFDPEVWTR